MTFTSVIYQWCIPHNRGTHSNSQQTEKLISKTLLCVVFVEIDYFLCQTFDLVWTNNVKFAKKTKFGTQFLVRRCAGLGNRHTGQGVLAYQSSFVMLINNFSTLCQYF